MNTKDTTEVEEFNKKWHELGIPNGCLAQMMHFYELQLQKAREQERHNWVNYIKARMNELRLYPHDPVAVAQTDCCRDILSVFGVIS